MWEPIKPAPPPTQTLAPLPGGRVQDFMSDMVKLLEWRMGSEADV